MPLCFIVYMLKDINCHAFVITKCYETHNWSPVIVVTNTDLGNNDAIKYTV